MKCKLKKNSLLVNTIKASILIAQKRLGNILLKPYNHILGDGINI